jgi:hypothetical protein
MSFIVVNINFLYLLINNTFSLKNLKIKIIVITFMLVQSDYFKRRALYCNIEPILVNFNDNMLHTNRSSGREIPLKIIYV